MLQYWKQFLLRSIREGIIQLWRNKFLSSTTVFLGALILFLLNFVFAIQFFVDISLKNLESRADFSVPLDPKYESFLLSSLRNDIDKNFSVELKLLPAENFSDFSVPERLHIKFKDLTQISEIFERLKNPRYDGVVGKIDGAAERDFVLLVDKLLGIRELVNSASFWLMIVFVFGGITLAVNAFRIAIFSRRHEVFVSRLVGADTAFIVGPFLWEGVMLGFFSSIVAMVFFVFTLRNIPFLPGGDVFLYFWNHIFSYEILVSGIVGMFGAWLAIKKYLTGKFNE